MTMTMMQDVIEKNDGVMMIDLAVTVNDAAPWFPFKVSDFLKSDFVKGYLSVCIKFLLPFIF